jgi:hypothetical protein
MRAAIAVVITGALLAAPAPPGPTVWRPSEEALAKRLSGVGLWDFESLATRADGQPECHEMWFFKRDGTGWVQSGKERVTNRWRILSTASGESNRLLYITALTSSGEPDCMGHSAELSGFPEQERGFYVRFTTKSSALLCGLAEFQHSFDRKKVAPLANGRDDCWGRLTQVARDEVRNT